MIYFNLRFQWRRCFIELLACENGLIKMLQLYDSTHPLPLTRKLQKFLSYGDYLRFVLSSIFFIFGFDLFTLFSLSRVLTQGYSNGIEKEKKERFFKKNALLTDFCCLMKEEKFHCFLFRNIGSSQWWRILLSQSQFVTNVTWVNMEPVMHLDAAWHVWAKAY